MPSFPIWCKIHIQGNVQSKKYTHKVLANRHFCVIPIPITVENVTIIPKNAVLPIANIGSMLTIYAFLPHIFVIEILLALAQ
jgi:hypothetical protein